MSKFIRFLFVKTNLSVAYKKSKTNFKLVWNQSNVEACVLSNPWTNSWISPKLCDGTYNCIAYIDFWFLSDNWDAMQYQIYFRIISLEGNIWWARRKNSISPCNQIFQETKNSFVLKMWYNYTVRNLMHMHWTKSVFPSARCDWDHYDESFYLPLLQLTESIFVSTTFTNM